MPEENNKLDYRSAIARIRQERSDAGKALTAAQVGIGSDLEKKGEAGGFGSSIGKYLGPVAMDFIVGTVLDLVAPGVGTAYQSAKSNPLLKAGGTAAYTYAGSKLGGDYGSSTVDVRDATKEVNSYLGDTVSGTRAKRFDRGATESLDLQSKEQIEMLEDLIGQKARGDAIGAGAKSLFFDVATGVNDNLSEISSERALTTEDYLNALSSGGGEDKTSIMSQIFDFSGLQLKAGGSPLANAPGEASNFSSSMMTSSPLNYEKLLSDLSKAFPRENRDLSSDAQGFLDSLTAVKTDKYGSIY